MTNGGNFLPSMLQPSITVALLFEYGLQTVTVWLPLSAIVVWNPGKNMHCFFKIYNAILGDTKHVTFHANVFNEVFDDILAIVILLCLMHYMVE